jgi:hypothetical protein
LLQCLILLNAVVGVCLHGWRAPVSAPADASAAMAGSRP